MTDRIALEKGGKRRKILHTKGWNPGKKVKKQFQSVVAYIASNTFGTRYEQTIIGYASMC